MQQRSDRELLADLAGSNRTTALAECLARYGQMVHRTARRITNDEHLAEDVCQAVFLVLLRKAAALANVASLAAWLHRVAILAARNTVKMEMRRRKREEKAAMVHDLSREPPTKLPTGIDQAIDCLPEVFRRVIVAHYLEGRPYAEVASQLGVSEETARMRGSRALDRLRRSLAPTTAGITVAALGSALVGEAAAASAAPLAAGQAAAIQAAVLGSASAQTSAVAGAVMKAMFWTKAKLFGAAVAMAAIVAVPAAVLLKPANPGLVGQYRFDEGSGTRVADASPSGNHGTMMGGVTRVAGRKPGSSALSFDGKTGYVQLSQDLNQWLGGTATMMFWVNTRQTGSGYPPVCVTGVDILAKTDDVHWGFLDEMGRIGIGAGDDLYLQGKIPVEQMTARSAKPINDGQWHHVALTRDAALGQMQVYVDGALAATNSTGAKGRKTTPFFSLGRKEVFPRPERPVLYFQGMLAEVALYDRVLSASEIEAAAK